MNLGLVNSPVIYFMSQDFCETLLKDFRDVTKWRISTHNPGEDIMANLIKQIYYRKGMQTFRWNQIKRWDSITLSEFLSLLNGT